MYFCLWYAVLNLATKELLIVCWCVSSVLAWASIDAYVILLRSYSRLEISSFTYAQCGVRRLRHCIIMKFVHVLGSAVGVHFVASLWCSGLWLAWGSDQRLRVYPMFCRWICGIARVAPSECGDYLVAGLILCRVAGQVHVQ